MSKNSFYFQTEIAFAQVKANEVVEAKEQLNQTFIINLNTFETLLRRG